jgi:hypothetical protein
MLNFIGTIIIVATTIVVLNAVISSLPVGRLPRLLLALLAGSWTGLAVALASRVRSQPMRAGHRWSAPWSPFR